MELNTVTSRSPSPAPPPFRIGLQRAVEMVIEERNMARDAAERKEEAQALRAMQQELERSRVLTRWQKFVKIQTQLIWVFAMVVLGAADMGVHWLNWYKLSQPSVYHGLVVGPAPYSLWLVLLIFTIVGTLLWIPETVNTLSSFCNKGQTKIPVVWEILGVMCLEQIPLQATNFFICRCRANYYENSQTLVGTIIIVYVFTRFVWYAHMEGKLIKRDKDHVMSKGLFMLCCALYSVAMAFPVMMWRTNFEPTVLAKDQAQDVSIFLFRAPFFESTRVHNYDISSLIKAQGLDPVHPYLVGQIYDIVSLEAGEEVSVDYKCAGISQPPECPHDGAALRFRFVYVPTADTGPYGEIRYNFAVRTHRCVPAEQDLSEHWQLFYMKRSPAVGDNTEWRLDSPWPASCLAPKPSYSKHIEVCGSVKPTTNATLAAKT